MNLLKHLKVLFLSNLIVFASLSIPVKVWNKADMAAVELGYPLSFVTQDFSRLDPPSFPRYYASGIPWEYPLSFHKPA